MKLRLLPLFAALLSPALTDPALAQAPSQRPRATPAPGWPFHSRATPAPKPGVTTAPAAPAQAAALAAERAKLIDGVKTLPRLGLPGAVAVYGPLAFPLVTTADAKGAEVLAAAGSVGKGRAVIFGQTGYLGGDATDADLEKLLLNAVRWCSGKEKPRVGIKGAKTGALLDKHGLRHEQIRKLEKSTLTGCDVLIASVQDLTDEGEAAALKSYLEGGGGFIGAITGWAFGQTSGGKDFATAFLGNQALAGGGLAWTDEGIGSGSIEVPAEIPPLLNASTAIAALLLKAGAPPPAASAIEQATKTIQFALTSMPAASKPPFQKLIAGMLSGAAKAPVPTPEKPLKESSDAEARARASLDARLSSLLAPGDIQPHPAAEKFPGRPAAQARPITKTVTIDPRVPGWHSLGLYADAGAKIEVKLAPEFAGRGYAVRIGCHKDLLYHLDQWKRMPEITTQTPLSTPTTLAANAFGGLLYLVVPGSAKASAPFPVTVSGGIESPLFILGQTTLADWRERVSKLPAPWAELATKKIIWSVPSDRIRALHDPEALMKFWDQIMDAQADLAAIPHERERPERIVADVQISAGYMHSGYPIMVPTDRSTDVAMTLRDLKQGSWGHFHELGHNHQEGEWTFEGTGEVTCNLFSLYCMETLCGQKSGEGHDAMKPEAVEKRLRGYLGTGDKFTRWKSDPFLALIMYHQLRVDFGWETYQKVFAEYRALPKAQRPKSDDEERDQWLVRFSRAAGKNLGPFFEAWGVPTSASARDSIKDLPGWMPKDWPKL